GRQRLSVDRIGEKDLIAGGFRQGQAALVLLLDATLDPPIQPGEPDINGAVQRSRGLQQRPQRRPRPLRGPDSLEQPWLAERARRKVGAAVPGAFHRHRPGHRRPSLEVVERQGQRGTHVSPHDELPLRRINAWNIEMDQQVMQADRGDRVTERLEGQGVIPDRQLQLVERDIRAGRDPVGRLLLGHQCLKWRSPVRTIATPAASAAAIASLSFTDPPGWTIARTPARAATSTPSGYGKNPSLASTEPAARGPARWTASSTASTRLICPAPMPTAAPSWPSTMAFERTCLTTVQANCRSVQVP